MAQGLLTRFIRFIQIYILKNKINRQKQKLFMTYLNAINKLCYDEGHSYFYIFIEGTKQNLKILVVNKMHLFGNNPEGVSVHFV